MLTFSTYSTDTGGGVTPLATEQTALAAIIALLPHCDTVDLLELQRNHVPRERLRAVSDEGRTRAVRLPEPTVAVPVAAIAREYRQAVIVEDDGELD